MTQLTAARQDKSAAIEPSCPTWQPVNGHSLNNPRTLPATIEMTRPEATLNTIPAGFDSFTASQICLNNPRIPPYRQLSLYLL